MTDIFSLFDRIARREDTPQGAVTHLVVGLGNTGKQYEGTRHNAGFLCLDAVAAAAGAKMTSLRFHSLTADTVYGSKRVLLMKPQTLMNLSGVAVAEAADFYHIPPEHIIVLCDDINFAVGHARIRLRGSHGGHNGLRDITARLGSENFVRVRIGVGQKPTPDYDLADWVLGHLPAQELTEMRETVAPRMADAVRLLLEGKPDLAMSQYSK